MYLDTEVLYNPLLIRLGYALLHFLWQGILFAGISAVGLQLLRRASSNQRYQFLVLMFALMSLAPLVTFLQFNNLPFRKSYAFVQAEVLTETHHVLQERQPDVPFAQVPKSSNTNDENSSAFASMNVERSLKLRGLLDGRPERVIGLIVFASAAGVCLFSLRLSFGWVCMVRLRRAGVSAIQTNIQTLCSSLCRSLRVRQTVEVLESAIVQVPAVVGWLRPLILIPTKLVTGLSDEELRAVLAHEIAHIRRHDFLVNLGQIAVENLLFYHPAVWWLSSRIRQEREHCCDDIAAQFCGSRAKVARALAILAAFNARTPTMVAASTGGSLVQRIRRLLQTDPKPEPVLSAGIGICLVLPLFVASYLIVSTSGFLKAIDPQEAAEQQQQQQLQLQRLQQFNAQQESQRILASLNAKQIAADEREAKEKEEQLELSKNLPLKFPENVQENEFAGVIVDEKGQPLAGAIVDIFPAFTGHETTTDEHGIFRYKLESSNKGQTRELRFSKEGYSPIYRQKQPLDLPDFCVVLNSKTYLEGQVVDENNQAVPMAKIVAAHPYGWRGEFHSFNRETVTTTDAKGRYRLYLNPEVYAVAAISERHGVERVQDIELVRNESQTLDLKLHAGVHFVAQVLDAETNAPVAGLTLYHRTNASARGVSNAEGLIEIAGALPGVEEYQIGSGPPVMVRGYYECPTEPFGSWWSPDAMKPWHRTATTEVALMFDMAADMKPVTIYVHASVRISGKIIDPDGNPVAGATVAPARTGTGNSLTGDTRYSVETKADGSYVVCLPPSGDAEYNLIAHDGKYLEFRKFAAGVTEPFLTKSGQRLDHVDIQLHRPATVRGRVTASNGRSVKGLAVRAHAADKRGNRYYDPTTKTNEDGTFEVRYIRPGEHFIQVEPFWMEAENAPAESSVEIEIEEGGAKEGIDLKQN